MTGNKSAETKGTTEAFNDSSMALEIISTSKVVSTFESLSSQTFLMSSKILRTSLLFNYKHPLNFNDEGFAEEIRGNEMRKILWGFDGDNG